jgi:histone H3/H4
VNGVISDHLRHLCDQAVAHAAAEGRKTVLDRDFEPFLDLP